MRFIDRSNIRRENGAIRLKDRLVGIMFYGLDWNNEFQAQERFITDMQKLVDNKYTLLRSVPLPGLDLPVPLILVGPSGVRAIYASGLKGIYRAQNEVWAAMDSRSRRFKVIQPNLVSRTSQMAHVLRAHLANQGFHIPEIEPVLFFSQPGVHVETVRPVVRVLLVDALARFAAGLIQSGQAIPPVELERMIEHLTQTQPTKEVSPAKPHPKPEPVGIGKLRMQVWQWLVLGGMMLVFIFIVITLVAVFLRTP